MFYVTFGTWLDNELVKRNWNRSELARRAGFHHSALSNIYAGRRKPGVDLCEAIANTMHIPPEEVFRAAGFLPPKPEADETIDEILYGLRLLPQHEKEDILDTINAKVKRHEREGNKKPTQKTKDMG